MIDFILQYGFTYLGKCKACGGNIDKYTLGDYTVKFWPRKKWFQLYQNKAQIAFGKPDQLTKALEKHGIIQPAPAA